MSYSPEKYEQEKALGIRRENGALNLKELKPLHYTIIQLHLQGFKNVEIANAVRRNQAAVSTILTDPLVVEELNLAYQEEQSRLKSLTSKSIDVVKKAMESDNVGIQLRGVDRFVKLRESVGDKAAGEETAEDVVQRILSGINVNIQVNNG